MPVLLAGIRLKTELPTTLVLDFCELESVFLVVLLGSSEQEKTPKSSMRNMDQYIFLKDKKGFDIKRFIWKDEVTNFCGIPVYEIAPSL